MHLNFGVRSERAFRKFTTTFNSILPGPVTVVNNVNIYMIDLFSLGF